DRVVVSKVAQGLAASFIDENLKARAVLTDGTDQFLQAQLDEAKGKLLDHEKKLEQYKREHAADLPSQLAANVQMIQNAQVQVRSLEDSLDRDRDRRNTLERQL